MPDFSMSAYYDAGFNHILPIIPPGAQISASSKSLHKKPEMLGKVPGQLRDDGWVGMADWVNYVPSQRDIAKWDQWDCGVGLVCKQVIAVDIDVTRDDLSELILSQVFYDLGFGPIRTGQAPKRLVLFRAEHEDALPSKLMLPFTDWDGQKHIVEVLGARQQFVLSGTHPKTGQPYSWDSDMVANGFDGLTIISVEELRTFMAGVAEVLELMGCEVGHVSSGSIKDVKSADTLRCSDLDLLRTAVDAIPNGDDTPREFFVSMAHAIKAAAVDDPAIGLEIFESWADRWPEGQADGEVQRVYESVKAAGLGVQWLFDQAKKHGFNAAGADFDFDDVDTGPAPKLDTWTPDADDDSIWNKFVYVNAVKRFVNLRTGALLDKEQFNDLHRTGEKEKAADAFLDSRRAHSFTDALDYIPGEHARVVRHADKGFIGLNMWRPGPVDRVDATLRVRDEDIKPWLDLGRHLFPEDEQRETLMNWMASLIQNPGVKPNWHPLIGSAVHGTGKDSFVMPLVRGLGDNVSVIRNSDVESEWTWWAENVQLVIVSEISTFERKAVMRRLISYMATPPDTIDINKKGIPQYSVPNRFGMIMFTNMMDGVAIEKHDRRFYVLWSDAGLLPESWYSHYHKWLESGGEALVQRHLMQRDLSNFSVKNNAPQTKAKESMRKASSTALDGTIELGLEDYEGPFAIDLFTLQDVEVWLRGKGIRAPGGHRLAGVLKSFGCVAVARARVAAGSGPVGIWARNRIGLYVKLAEDKGGAVVGRKMMSLKQKIGDAEAIADFSDTADPAGGAT